MWVANFLIPSREVWVAMEGSEVVGMLVLDEDWVDQLYVSPEHQRQGHGARLLAVAQTQRRSLVLWTFESNLGASRFYEAQGFALDGSPSSENEERAPAVCYRWRAI